MTVLELTHTIQNQMPVYPGTEEPQLTTACTIEQCGYQETLLHMYSHTGTHMDAPAHMIAGGATLDSYPPERFMGRAYVLDCRGAEEIGLPLLLAHREQIAGAEFLLFCTGWDAWWGSERYYRGFPCLTEEAARYVAGLGLKGVGEDSISLDPCDTTDYAIHHILLGAGLVNTENLKGLDKLAGRECFFLTLPLKYENADGCCCRVAAIIGAETVTGREGISPAERGWKRVDVGIDPYERREKLSGFPRPFALPDRERQRGCVYPLCMVSGLF